MTSFGAITLPSATPYTAQNAWLGCSSLTSFPALSFTSCTNFTNAWQNCTTLATFPANVFDTTGTLIGTAFSNAFFNCALTALSIENILVSLDTNGASNITLDLQGGTNAGASTWTAAANTAYSNLIAKGWTISANP
jgi:xanthine/uracil/vitamin C permease (AzgA family)